MTPDREVPVDATNPLGLDGIEFIEYSTSRPQALGQVLETMGFRPIARHRSREVLLYRQGDMNIIINAHSSSIPRSATPLEMIDLIDPDRIFLVQLADFMWQEIRSVEERITTARTFRVFPGEGAHSDQVAALVSQLDQIGYDGDYSFEVFNDDYQQMPLTTVAGRAYRAAVWLGEDVLKRAVPLPGQMRLRRDLAGRRRRSPCTRNDRPRIDPHQRIAALQPAKEIEWPPSPELNCSPTATDGLGFATGRSH